MHADRTNRAVLTFFGLLALLAGAAGMAASVGVFGSAFSRRTLLDNRVSAYIGQHGNWVWPAAAFIGLIITLAALRWILALLVSTDRASDITVPGSEDEGTTTLQPGALTGALAGEVGTYRGVDTAKGRVIGDASNPHVVLHVTATPAADLHALHRRLETEALPHARMTMADPSLPIQLDLDVSRRNS